MAPFRRLIEMIRTNSREFEADGRVLRLKQYMSSDARPPMIDMVLDALEVNTRVEALYIQNFELVRASLGQSSVFRTHGCSSNVVIISDSQLSVITFFADAAPKGSELQLCSSYCMDCNI